MQHTFRFLTGLALVGLSFSAQAQTVGIGTTGPDSNAALDISSGAGANKGLLIPRMTEGQRTAVTTTTAGMLVYQTNGTQPGFWYYTGTVWVALPSGVASGSGWLRTGNSGTEPGPNPGVGAIVTPATNFIGTSDNQDLVLSTNSAERLRITTNGSLYSRSANGLILNANDAPMITRGWNPFTSGGYNGLGRWGLFMRASQLSSGIPDNVGSSFGWVTWSEDSNVVPATLMRLNNNGNLSLGMGNTAATTRLSIVGTGTGNPNIVNATQSAGHIARFRDNGDVTLDLGSSGSTNGTWLQSTNATALGTNYPLRLNPNGGNVGVATGTTTPTTALTVGGAVATPYTTTGTATSFTLDNTHQTVRRFGACATITIPQAATCPGRLYTIINANGSGSSVALSVVSGSGIYDDVTNTTVTSLPVNQRITIQSDGTGWIVVGL